MARYPAKSAKDSLVFDAPLFNLLGDHGFAFVLELIRSKLRQVRFLVWGSLNFCPQKNTIGAVRHSIFGRTGLATGRALQQR